MQRYLKEVKKRKKEKNLEWKEEKERFCETRGISMIEVRMRRERGENIREQVEERDREEQGQKKYERIKRSRYNACYKKIRTIKKE